MQQQAQRNSASAQNQMGNDKRNVGVREKGVEEVPMGNLLDVDLI